LTSLKELAARVFGGGKAALSDLDTRVACFREVLRANNAALGHIARLQQALAGEIALGAADARQLLAGVTVQTFRMIVNLNRMTGDRFKEITARFETIKRAISKKAEVTPVLDRVGLVVPLESVDARLAEVVGQKSAFLGEARRILAGHVPEGFATTVEAYRAFLQANELGERVEQAMRELGPGGGADVAQVFRVSAQLTQLVETAPVPMRLIDAIQDAVRAIPGSARLRFAVRSSALQEGGLELSFAGQYRSLLGVSADNVTDAFRQVVASKYSPQAIRYRIGRGFDDHEVAMCCCVIGMIDAVAAGVLYSACASPDGPVTLVQAVRGLGLSAVDGSAEPDSYVLGRKTRKLVGRKLGVQRSLLRSSADEGTEKVDLGTRAGGLILADELVLRIAALAWKLDDALGTPIDMEWAVTGGGDVVVLQVRPQQEHAEQGQAPAKPRVGGAKVLLEGGARVSGGAASGPVCLVRGDLDMLRCPPGSVVVAREANPRLAVLLSNAAAIVADMGEVTGHLATVARELKVPALFATRLATVALENEALVTVDADAGVVYEGIVQAALADGAPARARARNPNVERLAAVADLIVPLTLRDRLASGYTPAKCATLHDIIRFCHQATIEAMFEMGDKAARSGAERRVRRLVSSVPIDCRVLDLGGGLRPDLAADEEQVSIDDLTCEPMRILWKGMTDPRLRWALDRPVSLEGFMSALVNYNFDQDSRVRSMGEPSYAFVTADYLSLNSRIGYHFSTVDVRLGDEVESNHLSFRFVGGSTGIEQRSRRALLLQRLLDGNGFETDCKADLVNARVRHVSREVLEGKVLLVGLLLGYANHLDMALVSDEALLAFERAFVEGRHDFRGIEADR
jgi:pyruvate,water dikinase